MRGSEVMSEKIISTNRKANHEYFISARYECGIVLTGTEIKSVRKGRVNIKESYVQIKENELWILGMHIGLYEQGNQFNHDETRTRKLLMHKAEILKLDKEVQVKGFTLIPLRVYLKNGLCKVEIGLAKGKKLYDKRESEKERDIKRDLEKEYKLR